MLNYVFLFVHEARAGRDEGAKARPVMVMTIDGRRVTVMPITTKGDVDPPAALAIPDPVRIAMGLRGSARSSLIPSQLNAFDWTGHDLRAIDASGSFHFGRCPPGFFDVALRAANGAVTISRDESPER